MSGLNKTICRNFSANGNCYYGEQCNFIHVAGGSGSSAAGPIPKSQRPCRHIAQHGFCKYEGKGCEFNHNVARDEGAVKSSSGKPTTKRSSAKLSEGLSLGSGGEMGEAYIPPGSASSTSSPSFPSTSPTTTTGPSLSLSINPSSPSSSSPAHSTPTGSSPAMSPGLSALAYPANSPTSSSLRPAAAGSRVGTPMPASYASVPDYHNAFPPLNSASSKPSGDGSSRPTGSGSLRIAGDFPEYDPTAAAAGLSRIPTPLPSDPAAFPEFDPTAIQAPSYYPSSTNNPGLSHTRSLPNTSSRKGSATTAYSTFQEYDPTYAAAMLSIQPPPPSQGAPGGTGAGRSVLGRGEPNYSGSGGAVHSTHSYPGVLPHTSPLANSESRRTIQSYFMSDTLRADLRRQAVAIRMTVDPDDPISKELPQTTHRYHSYYPLENIPQKKAAPRIFGYPSFVYKCISTLDGLPYAVRRVDGIRILVHDFALSIAEMWRKIQHPNVISIRDFFTGKDPLGGNAAFFVYDYHPCAETLDAKFFHSAQPGYLQENVLWSFTAQLLSALRVIHSNRLACRCIHPTKILLTGKNRLRISGVAILDVINFDGGKHVPQHQQEDLLSLGKLLLCLACKNLGAVQNPAKSMDFVLNTYSRDLHNLLLALLSPHPTVSHALVDEIYKKFAPRFIKEIEHLHNYTDLLESELAKEVESARLFRIIAKLGFINERPEFDMDPSWSETDNRYLLKLLRDYIFHQVHADGSPSVDLAHVVSCLNKLDAGTEEKVVLTSRDMQSMLIVSYKDLHKCVNSAFNELYKAGQEGVDRALEQKII